MEQQELQEIAGRIAEAEAWRDGTYGELWQDCWRRFRSRPRQVREGSNIFVPHTFMQCEVIRARLEESLFGQRPFIRALPRQDDDLARAEKTQLLLDWQLNERMDLPRLMGDELIASLIIYGTAVAYTGWQEIRRRRKHSCLRERPLLDEQGQPLADALGQPLSLPERQVKEEEATLYDDPLVANVALKDFYCDRRAGSISEARFCGHREYLTRQALDELVRQGKYHIDWDEVQRDGEESFDLYPTEARKGLYLVHHYWEDERHVVLLERSQCICDEENPFWHGEKPYDKGCFVALPGEFYGLGVPEILAGLQDELNTSRNQRIDYNSLALRRMWKLRRGCGLTARDLLWRQNGVLQVENMDDVQEINLQSLPSDAFSNEASVKQDMQDATGCHDIVMGMVYGQETATTTKTRDNNASLRFRSVTRMLVNDLLLPIARKCLSMDQQFLSGERLLRLTKDGGEQLLNVSADELAGEYDVVYCGAALESYTTREQDKAHALQAYSLALADPAYQKDDAARLRLFRKVLAGLDMEDSDQLLPAAATDSADAAQAGADTLATALGI